MNIIAIDPGPTHSAVIGWNGQRIQEKIMLANDDLMHWLWTHAQADLLAVEMVACYGMSVGAEVLETAVMVGRIQEAWRFWNCPFRKVYRQDVKMHLCHNMRAKDSNIRQALIDRFGKPGTKRKPGPLHGVTSHLWSALAVAVYAHDTICPDGVRQSDMARSAEAEAAHRGALTKRTK